MTKLYRIIGGEDLGNGCRIAQNLIEEDGNHVIQLAELESLFKEVGYLREQVNKFESLKYKLKNALKDSKK